MKKCIVLDLGPPFLTSTAVNWTNQGTSTGNSPYDMWVAPVFILKTSGFFSYLKKCILLKYS